MDHTYWAPEMQQNPNPSTNFSVLHTINHYPHNLISNPYQPSSVDYNNALFLPQPGPPPGVDPTYAPPPVSVNYAQQQISFESAEAAAAFYYPKPIVSWTADISQFEAAPSAAGVSTPNPAIQLQKNHNWKKGPKKTKVVQSVWCEVCKIDCNSKDVLNQHKLGKKHLRNLEKLKTTKITTMPVPPFASIPAAVVNTPAILAGSTAAVAASASLRVSTLAPTDKPIIGPEENPQKSEPSNSKKVWRKAATTEDLETKRRKVLEGGAAVDAVRACNICNVVCNSDTVFNYHIAGQKHAAMIKKLAARAGVGFVM